MPPILNIIHLQDREDRLQNLMEQTNEQSIAYKTWDGVRASNSAAKNINAAHKLIVLYAKGNSLPYVTIAEDDIKFFAPGAWKYYLSQMPLSFDLYCGVMLHGELDGNRIIKGMSGTNTLYTIHERFYDAFLSSDNEKHLDRELGKLALQKEYYVCIPMVCTQTGGFSDNFKRKMYYDEYLIDKPLFKA